MASTRAIAALALLAALGCQSPWIVQPGEVPEQDCAGASEETHAVWLIGDAGEPTLPLVDVPGLVDPVLTSLRADVSRDADALGADAVTVLFLGDNVYPRGLPPEGALWRRPAERILEAQIAAAGPAYSIFLAGNHDWDAEGDAGWDHVAAQRKFVEQSGPRVRMLPPGGCGGPARVDIGRWLRLVLIDPIGMSHLAEFPELHADVCPYANSRDAYLALAEEFITEGRHVVLGLHHPLITAGPHGGHYTWKQHLFPLTDFWPWAWFPLPVFGSIYPLSRQLGITGTDLSSSVYSRWISYIYRATTPWSPVLIAAGHEHSLQVHRDAVGLFYAVSGAGSTGKVDRVEEVPTELMALAAPGYMRLGAHADGSLGLSVRALVDGNGARTVFRACVAKGRPEMGRRYTTQ